MNQKSIALSKFLSRYHNLTGDNLTKLTHKDVKILFPHLERYSFDELESNPELLYSGDVVMVSDGKSVIPYRVPKIELFEEDPLEVCREEEPKIVITPKHYRYDKMSIYELRCLLERKFNHIKNRREARKELESRGIVLKKKYVRENAHNIKKKDMEE